MSSGKKSLISNSLSLSVGLIVPILVPVVAKFIIEPMDWIDTSYFPVLLLSISYNHSIPVTGYFISASSIPGIF